MGGIRCAYVGAHLRSCSDRGAGPFLEGAETPSIADIFVASVVAVATKRYGCTGGEEENNNALRTWLASLWRRPSFQKHLDFFADCLDVRACDVSVRTRIRLVFNCETCC